MKGLVWLIVLLLTAAPGTAATCDNCADFGAAQSWGIVSSTALTETSGIASSQQNSGVLWVHNDGSRQRLFALSTNGTQLASFSLGIEVSDLEDIATGPGPEPGALYLYVGDIGASDFPNTVRSSVTVFRVREPKIQHAWAGAPVSGSFDSVETITLRYPSGAYNAETLMFDSKTGDIFVVTKQPDGARVYRASIAAATDGSTLELVFVRQVNLGNASAGDISADGNRVILRREDYAAIWTRCEGETIGDTLARTAATVPLSPQEVNGEGITFLADGTGYMTVSEGQAPALYFFLSRCPAAPRFLLGLVNQTAFAGGTVEFTGASTGFPAPSYQWRFNGAVIQGQTGSTLRLIGVSTAQAGTYELTASNTNGSATSSAILTVNPKPNLRITEVQSSTAPSPNLPSQDWWEVTSFESQPVSLSGWRFNDSSGDLTDAFTLPADLVINPGETIVFVESLDAAQFRNWWGPDNLRPGLKIVTYTGAGLSLSASGDGLRLWNQLATNPADTVTSVNFGTASNGVSFNYDPVTDQFGSLSQLGVNGVFRAAGSTDIGSPGVIYGPLTAPTLRVNRSNRGLRIEFEAAPGATYQLESKGDLTMGQWLPVDSPIKSTAGGTLAFEVDAGAARFFYRVVATR